MKEIKGGVAAPKGFTANGIHCGIRKNKSKKDLALVFSEKRGSAAAVYTQNLVKGAPIKITKENLSDGYAQAIICNSGNANTCNADGEYIAKTTCEKVGEILSISPADVIVASTGVIGQKLDVEPIINALGTLKAGLGDKSADAAAAIATTDTVLKEAAYEFKIKDKVCRIGGIAKGSGMINPNMATMLVFVTSDVKIAPALLKTAVKDVADVTFNMISVDGDTSTNDMLSIICNGMAENEEITEKNEDYFVFFEAFTEVCRKLSRLIAKDGEGATKLLECNVIGAKTLEAARISAKSVIKSNLLKAAMFGSDANWGRVLCALGYSGADIDVDKIDVDFRSEKGVVAVCRKGAGVDFSEEIAKKVLSSDEIDIDVNLNDGEFSATAWGCDLTYDYVKINGDYRT